MKNLIIIPLVNLTLVISTGVGVAYYFMANMKIDELILCSAGEGNYYIPRSVCGYYMQKFRMTKSDIQTLNDGPGLEVILNLSDANKKFALAKLFLSKGLDVNGVNHRSKTKLTPMHAAVLYNDVKTAAFLVSQNANITIRDSRSKLTALELAKYLQKKKPEEDRSKIIELLANVD